MTMLYCFLAEELKTISDVKKLEPETVNCGGEGLLLRWTHNAKVTVNYCIPNKHGTKRQDLENNETGTERNATCVIYVSLAHS